MSSDTTDQFENGKREREVEEDKPQLKMVKEFDKKDFYFFWEISFFK